MDPISSAMAAFSVVSAGIKAGRDLGSLARPLAKMFDGIDDAKTSHNKKKNGLFVSANEEALSTFLAKTKADDLEKELREIIVNTRGISAWHQLVALRTQIRVERKKKAEDEARRKEELQELILYWFLGSIIVLGIVGAIFFFLAIKSGRL